MRSSAGAVAAAWGQKNAGGFIRIALNGDDELRIFVAMLLELIALDKYN
ncbi:hypothetical protein [Paraburkholderia sp. Cpub6]|nr:hypothetical protein [Paraburkholderia sp. Cpub6]MBB5457992.1 hypothetical protein [Paraburkholderia sp. Cpub6]